MLAIDTYTTREATNCPRMTIARKAIASVVHGAADSPYILTLNNGQTHFLPREVGQPLAQWFESGEQAGSAGR